LHGFPQFFLIVPESAPETVVENTYPALVKISQPVFGGTACVKIGEMYYFHKIVSFDQTISCSLIMLS
jgi:hypothetical protein